MNEFTIQFTQFSSTQVLNPPKPHETHKDGPYNLHLNHNPKLEDSLRQLISIQSAEPEFAHAALLDQLVESNQNPKPSAHSCPVLKVTPAGGMDMWLTVDKEKVSLGSVHVDSERTEFHRSDVVHVFRGRAL